MGISGGVVEYQYPGDVSTFAVSAAVVGGQLVELTEDFQVGPAGADSTKCVGVALYSQATVGQKVAVARVGIYYLTATGAIAFGESLECAAAGTVATAAAPTVTTLVGIAYEDIANGQKGRVALRAL